ncbi:MAG: hypothetical protein H6613_18015 [Ignavibacteriales bacterium]|nr:hypothetical protein [Ignavibacteriales bacterium]
MENQKNILSQKVMSRKNFITASSIITGGLAMGASFKSTEKTIIENKLSKNSTLIMRHILECLKTVLAKI